MFLIFWLILLPTIPWKPIECLTSNDTDGVIWVTSVGGIRTNYSRYPFIVSMRHNNKFKCAGVILDSYRVLTAAHCFTPKPTLQRLSIHAGRKYRSGSREPGEQIFMVRKYLIHPLYTGAVLPSKGSAYLYDHDIAIVFLNDSIKYVYAGDKDDIMPVYPAKLPLGREDLKPGTFCCSAGWGETEGHGDQNDLNEICVPAWSREKCNSDIYHNGRISRNMLCAGNEFGSIDTCSGDSGGPLQCGDMDFKLYGIVSWGIGCAEENKPGVYTNIARYIYWIRRNV